MGLRGQLSAGEILEQIFHAKRLARASFSPVKTSVVIFLSISVDGSCGAPRCKFQHRYPKKAIFTKGSPFKRKHSILGIQPLCFGVTQLKRESKGLAYLPRLMVEFCLVN